MVEVTVEVEVGLAEAEAVEAEEQAIVPGVQTTPAIAPSREDYVLHLASMHSIMVRKDLLRAVLEIQSVTRVKKGQNNLNET